MIINRYTYIKIVMKYMSAITFSNFVPIQTDSKYDF